MSRKVREMSSRTLRESCVTAKTFTQRAELLRRSHARLMERIGAYSRNLRDCVITQREIAALSVSLWVGPFHARKSRKSRKTLPIPMEDMMNLLLKALGRTLLIFLFAIVLMIAILLITHNDPLASFTFPVGVYLGILAYMRDDVRQNAWLRSRK
jgi:hypothetical protein